MKKILAIVLALIMAFSAFTMAFAEEAAPVNSDPAAADESTTGFDLIGTIKGIHREFYRR